MRHIKKGKRKDNKTIMCSTTKTEMNRTRKLLNTKKRDKYW